MSLRNAHALAIMTQYRIGMTHLETVTSLGLVTQIELALITYFRESLPEPGQNWDSQKRARRSSGGWRGSGGWSRNRSGRTLV